MYCCEYCFQNEWLCECVKEDSTHTGQCDFCERDNVDLIHVSELTPLLKNAIDIYYPLQYGENYGYGDDPQEHGEPLISFLQWDWQVFDDDLFGSDKAAELLEQILNYDWDDDSGEAPIDANELYSRKKMLSHISPAEDWDIFCEQVREQSDLDPDFSEALEATIWEHEKVIKENACYFRARPNWDGDVTDIHKHPYRGDGIGAPPPDKAMEGRVNRESESVLYVSEQEETAIAEIRPPRGSIVTAGKLCTANELRILDLGEFFPEPNPFTTEQLAYWMEHSELLNAFSWALSKPLERTDDTRDYRPSQKLSAWLRKQGFDGIRYPSAMRDGGHNIVFFDPKSVGYVDSRLVQIMDVNVSHKDYEEEA